MKQTPGMTWSYLRTNRQLPVDFDEELFAPFLSDTRFVEWMTGDKLWGLNLYGGPGRGKTTLATHIAQYLRSNNISSPVAVIFIQRSTIRCAAPTVEDFLKLIYSQLGRHCYYNDASSLRELRDIIRVALASSRPTFLIVDGFDDLPVGLQRSLLDELYLLKQATAKLLITRRVPEFQPYPDRVLCDGCEEEGDDLTLFWECRKCAWILCYACKDIGAVCPEIDHEAEFIEPYDDIDIQVNVCGQSLNSFVRKDLEREYLNEDIEPAIVDSIVYKSKNNMTLAKLRLDHARELAAPQDILSPVDRLPRGIVALYDREISHIETGSEAERKLILVAVVATALTDSIPLDTLAELLRNLSGVILQGTNSSHLTVDRFLRSARGLLCMGGAKVAGYHQDLLLYVRQNYNRELVEANQYLEMITKSNPESAFITREGNTKYTYTTSPCSKDLLQITQNHTISPINPTSFLPHRQINTDDTDPGHFSSSSSAERPFKTSTITLAKPQSEGALVRIPGEKFDKLKIDGDITQMNSLCDFCENEILRAKVLQGSHHRSVEELAAATNAGCPFCSGVYGNKKDAIENQLLNNEKPEWTRFYWSIRTTSRTSDTEDITAVTFRPATSRLRATLRRYFIISENDLSNIPDPAQLGSSTHPRHTESQIKTWIQDCNENHPYCVHQSTETYLPKRLVDIGTGNQNIVKVVVTKESSIKGPYATLSHCWGPPKFPIKVLLKRDNEARLMEEGIPLDQLTKNFQEAIEVARSIGMRYIWIDSLCIVQGKGGDFSEEGQYMHKVYRFSYCNIVAADSQNSHGGLFRTRNPHEVIPARHVAGERPVVESGPWRVLDERVWTEQLLDSPIYRRGWVFQERMLSPRILHFTKSQIFWDCSTISACEIFPSGLPFSLDQQASTDRRWRGRLQESANLPRNTQIDGPNDDSLETFWKSALFKYTQCDLTNQMDKTRAIWSIAKLVRDSLLPGDEYGCGLWSSALQEQLAWRVESCVERARIDELQCLFPSWSWASVQGPIITQKRLVDFRCYVAESHNGGDVSFHVGDLDEKGDKETQFLENDSLDINGYLGNGVLVDSTRSGICQLSIRMDTECRFGNTGTFEAFPDEKVTAGIISPRQCQFIILAASDNQDHYTEKPIDQDTDGFIADLRYSGIGLILEPHATPKYIERQKDILKNLEASEDKNYVCKNRIANLRDLIAKAEGGTSKPTLRFRRIGAFHFRDVCVDTWNSIEAKGRTAFWLD